MTTTEVSKLTSADLSARARDCAQQLARAAYDVRTLTYSELADAVGMPVQGPWRVLTEVHRYCVDNNLPWLTAILVAKNDHRPSADWTGTWADGAPLESEAIWRMAVAQVFGYPHWEKVIAELA